MRCMPCHGMPSPSLHLPMRTEKAMAALLPPTPCCPLQCAEAWLVQGGYCRSTCKLCGEVAPKVAAPPAGEVGTPGRRAVPAASFLLLPATLERCPGCCTTEPSRLHALPHAAFLSSPPPCRPHLPPASSAPCRRRKVPAAPPSLPGPTTQPRPPASPSCMAGARCGGRGRCAQPAAAGLPSVPCLQPPPAPSVVAVQRQLWPSPSSPWLLRQLTTPCRATPTASRMLRRVRPPLHSTAVLAATGWLFSWRRRALLMWA